MSSAMKMTGKKHGRLTVIDRNGTDKHHNATWNCLCECGNETVVVTAKLRSGHTQSCGCLQRERTSIASRTHGKSNGSPEYEVWAAMLQRCENKNDKSYMNYGGRGLRVCSSWKSFETFMLDMGDRPTTKHTIERVNNDEGYNKDNCLWTDRTTQNRNQRIRKDNTTGVRGVQWDKDRGKYRVTISKDKKKIYIGLYDCLAEATKDRKQAEVIYWGGSSL